MAIKSWPFPPQDSDRIVDYLKRLYIALVENSIALNVESPSKIDSLAVDPSTTGWGASDAGRIWHNSVDGAIKYWDGGAIVTLL